MRKVVFFFLLLFSSTIVYALPSISSTNVYFYQMDKGEVLYEKDAQKEVSIASLTKIMTASVALDLIENLEEKVTLKNADFKGLWEANASQAGFRVGETVTYRDLLYGLLLPSGAECALALSNHLVGSEEAFALKMNEKASQLGLEHTKFQNTTGLDEEGHYSTAEEVATILLDALKNPEFVTIFSAREYDTSNGRHHFVSTLEKNVASYDLDISYIKGSKTGYTYDAGLCLASIAEDGEDHYLLVTLGADYKAGKPYQVIDSNALYQYFFENYAYQKVLTKGEKLKTIADENGELHDYYATSDIELYLPKNVEIKSKYDGLELLTYDMEVGSEIGKYTVFSNEEVLAEETFRLEEKIVKPRQYPNIFILVGVAILFLLLILILIHRKKKKKKKRKAIRK